MSRSEDRQAIGDRKARHQTDAFLAEMARISADHEPGREPYASLSRERIAELIEESARIGDHRRSLILQEYLLDKMSEEELQRYSLTNDLTAWLIEKLGAQDSKQCLYLSEVAARVVREAAAEMPAAS